MLRFLWRAQKEMQQKCRKGLDVSFMVDVYRRFNSARTCEGYNLRVTDPTVNTLIDMAGPTYQCFSHTAHTRT